VGVVTWFERGRLSTPDVTVSLDTAATLRVSRAFGQSASSSVYSRIFGVSQIIGRRRQVVYVIFHVNICLIVYIRGNPCGRLS